MKFLRRAWYKHSKLGKGRKSKQVWRKPTGRHNKMREKKKGAAAVVSIGYRTEKSKRGLIDGKTPIVVRNIQDLEKATKQQVVIIGNIGLKKRIELLKKAKEKNIEILNVNVKKTLRKHERKNKSTKKKNEPKN